MSAGSVWGRQFPLALLLLASACALSRGQWSGNFVDTGEVFRGETIGTLNTIDGVPLYKIALADGTRCSNQMQVSNANKPTTEPWRGIKFICSDGRTGLMDNHDVQIKGNITERRSGDTIQTSGGFDEIRGDIGGREFVVRTPRGTVTIYCGSNGGGWIDTACDR